MTSDVARIELLYFESCPSYRIANRLLREALDEERLSADIALIQVVDQTDARRLRFVGSPTIRFDGVDPFLRGEAAYGIECRLFATPEGLKGWPTKDMLRSALREFTSVSDPIDR